MRALQTARRCVLTLRVSHRPPPSRNPPAPFLPPLPTPLSCVRAGAPDSPYILVRVGHREPQQRCVLTTGGSAAREEPTVNCVVNEK